MERYQKLFFTYIGFGEHYEYYENRVHIARYRKNRNDRVFFKYAELKDKKQCVGIISVVMCKRRVNVKCAVRWIVAR